jgi:ornithine decarboxylase
MTEINPEIGFDCASLNEINATLPLVKPNKIIYAQPCKKHQDIKIAQAQGVKSTVVDSVEEVEKLAAAGWTGSTLVRLLVDDMGSKQPFGKKFGAPFPWLEAIFRTANYHKINMTGFSFHVGSECQTPVQYEKAIQLCNKASKISEAHKFTTETIDIGGGFLPQESSFIETAKVIRQAQSYFPKNTQWIAEPGRFLAAPTHTLYTTVIGKKPCWPLTKEPSDPKWRITIDESVYGAFSNIPFDHQNPVFEMTTQTNSSKRPTTIFGRTCDSGDTIGTHIPLGDVEVGTVLRVPNMGAYTTVTASEFNGFPKAERIYELN